MNTDTAEELIAFRAALAENVASVVDSLEAIGEELAVSDERELASFFEDVAAAVRLFAATRTVGQGQRTLNTLRHKDLRLAVAASPRES